LINSLFHLQPQITLPSLSLPPNLSPTPGSASAPSVSK
jgi:hypothetical protein